VNGMVIISLISLPNLSRWKGGRDSEISQLSEWTKYQANATPRYARVGRQWWKALPWDQILAE
jgi:hypothetical protein